MSEAASPLLGVSTGARVADYVRRLVWEGALRAGDRVVQGEIADALGVSRVPVREGLVALEAEGLVRHEPQRGVFVLGLDPAFVRDHYALLGLVLGYVIEQAVRRGDEGFRKEIEALATEIEGCPATDDLFAQAVRFKEIVRDAAGSARARVAVGGLERLVPGNSHREVPGAIEIARDGIPAVADAVRRGDAAAAGEATRDMASRLGDAVVAVLERREASRSLAP